MNAVILRSKQKKMDKVLSSLPFTTYTDKLFTGGQEICINRYNLLPTKYQTPLARSKRYSLLKKNIQPTKNSHSIENRQITTYHSLQPTQKNQKVGLITLQPNSQQKSQKRYHPRRKKSLKNGSEPKQPVGNQSVGQLGQLQSRFVLLKQKARELAQKGNYQPALDLLNSASQLYKTDLNYLQLKAFCYLKLCSYQKAIEVLRRVIIFDRKNCRKAYIWSSLCELQLGHNQKSHLYLDECIRFFPLNYEAQYLKAKLLIKAKHYDQALDLLLKAHHHNPLNTEVTLHIADCLQKLGDFAGAMTQYKHSLTHISRGNWHFAAKYAILLARASKFQESEQVILKCLQLCGSSDQPKLQALLLQCQCRLAITHFKNNQYDLCSIKGQEVLIRGKTRWAAEAAKVVISSKIALRDFYGAAALAERLELATPNHDLEQLLIFCEGVMLLMRKKALQAIPKLHQCEQLLQKDSSNYLTVPITRVIHLYLYYAYFVTLDQNQALQQLKQQRSSGLDPLYQSSTAYNQALTEGFKAFYSQQLDTASQCFQKALDSQHCKTDVLLYQAITLFHTLLHNPTHKQAEKEFFRYLDRCCNELQQGNTNNAAYALYYRALYKATQQQYSSSLEDLDLAIAKSQHQLPKFFYLRALVWSLTQNYNQAVSDASICLSYDSTQARCYELRARCLQIEGDPAQAFADLQTFISLRPNDTQIHKLAGHLLFQNGSFEEALQAISLAQISPAPQELEVYLTRSKTHFLLGNFQSASADMQQAALITASANHSASSANQSASSANQSVSSAEMLFDSQLMHWLADLLHPYHSAQPPSDQYTFEAAQLQLALQQLRHMQELESKGSNSFGRIFKLPQMYTLGGLCHFYLGEYGAAADLFMQSTAAKVATFQQQTQGHNQIYDEDYQEDQLQKQQFVNQMHYNIALCFCLTHQYKNAQKYITNCTLEEDSHNYEVYQQLVAQIRGTLQISTHQQYPQLFSSSNKISKFLPPTQVPFKSQQHGTVGLRQMKVCIPYPKVQPPNIVPQFDRSLIEESTLDNIERRPEAPWILKQNNKIRFTERVQTYSGFSLGESSVEDTKKELIGETGFEQNLEEEQRMLDGVKLDGHFNKP